jgi:hypothetical protein
MCSVGADNCRGPRFHTHPIAPPKSAAANHDGDGSLKFRYRWASGFGVGSPTLKSVLRSV